ncbi:glycerol-3-phosphate acyltransferase [bacterium]|nr:glycerol-3-phosphate acyltransferase [bacterium]
MSTADLTPATHSPQLSTPLVGFSSIRERILENVVQRTMAEFPSNSLDLVLGEALYQERVRIKRGGDNLFTRGRTKRDRQMLSVIQKGLLRPPGQVDRHELLRVMTSHFAQEIGGRFDTRIYDFTTGMLPIFFNWLLNAASLQQFNPKKQRDLIHNQLIINGEVDHLRMLAQHGTILLVPTHQSNIDSVLIGFINYLLELPPFSYGAGLNLFNNPVLSFFMSHLGSYTVDRRKGNAIYKNTLKNYSTAILREGVHSIFFPGGGRSRSGAIESKLKLGLLGTALEAQTENLIEGSPKPNVYIVPMVMSYHYVLEAGSLIEDYLAEAGKHRFIITDDESFQPIKVARFFWKAFTQHSKITVRIGRPMDVFGNFVDEGGHSIGPNGTTIDPKKWLTTRGVLCKNAQRDREYVLGLGARISERFHRENTVLSSHLVAFSYFEALRQQYPNLDLYRFLRLSRAQRILPVEKFLEFAEQQRSEILKKALHRELYVCPELTMQDSQGDSFHGERVLPAWIREGVRQLGQLHDAAVVRIDGDEVFTDDLTLVYYYRNRLAGYGLSIRASELKGQLQGTHDRKGFLA